MPESLRCARASLLITNSIAQRESGRDIPGVMARWDLCCDRRRHVFLVVAHLAGLATETAALTGIFQKILGTTVSSLFLFNTINSNHDVMPVPGCRPFRDRRRHLSNRQPIPEIISRILHHALTTKGPLSHGLGQSSCCRQRGTPLIGHGWRPAEEAAQRSKEYLASQPLHKSDFVIASRGSSIPSTC